MAFDNTVTERDMDVASQQLVHGFRGDTGDYEPDLAVDGLSDGFFARLLRLFGLGHR